MLLTYFLVLYFPEETLPEIEPKTTNGSNSHPKAGLSLPMSFPFPAAILCTEGADVIRQEALSFYKTISAYVGSSPDLNYLRSASECPVCDLVWGDLLCE